MKYVADDGTVFSTETECLSYENNPMKQLATLIGAKINQSYNDDAGFSIIEESSVLDFIVSHIDEINKILKTKEEPSTSDGWVSNIGNTRAHYPASISCGTDEIEVKFRNGKTETGIADDWGYSWMDEDEDWDIVAYRVLKD